MSGNVDNVQNGSKSRGRPPKPKYNIKYMVRTIRDYTDGTAMPILKECCFNQDWNYDYVMQLQREHEDLSQSIKRLLMKKEVVLELGMLTGRLNTGGAAFSLKQLGWRDRQDIINVNRDAVDDDELTKSLEELAKTL